MSTTIDVKKYLKADLFDELHLQELSGEERVSFLEKFGEIINHRVTMRVLDELSEDQKDQLEVIMNKPEPDQQMLAHFLQKEVPRFLQIVEEEVAGHKKQLIEKFK